MPQLPAEMTDRAHLQNKLDRMTRRSWFFGLFVLLQFVVPPFASKGYKFPDDWGNVISHALGNAIVYSHSELYPIYERNNTPSYSSTFLFRY